MRVIITRKRTITMVQAGTMASFRSTASTGAMTAGPLDPRMPVTSAAQVSCRTEQRTFLCSLHESTCSARDICLAAALGISICPSVHPSSQCPTYPSFLMDTLPSANLSLLFLCPAFHHTDLFSLLYRIAR